MKKVEFNKEETSLCQFFAHQIPCAPVFVAFVTVNENDQWQLSFIFRIEGISQKFSGLRI